MKTYTIELTEAQMRLVAYCLEDISRFAAGECDLRFTVSEVLRGLPPDENIRRVEQVKILLDNAKRVLFPDLGANANMGYDGNAFIGNTYQIYRTILHRLAIDNNWHNVYSSEPLPSGNMGAIKIEKKSYDNLRKH